MFRPRMKWCDAAIQGAACTSLLSSQRTWSGAKTRRRRQLAAVNVGPVRVSSSLLLFCLMLRVQTAAKTSAALPVASTRLKYLHHRTARVTAVLCVAMCVTMCGTACLALPPGWAGGAA